MQNSSVQKSRLENVNEIDTCREFHQRFIR